MTAVGAPAAAARVDAPRVELLGGTVRAFPLETLTARGAELVAAGERRRVLNHNLHSLWFLHHDPAVRALYARTDDVHIDGMPVVWAGRLLGHSLAREHRITYVDWLPVLAAEAARRGWRLFFVGGAPGVGERAAAVLRERHPGLALTVHHGFFDASPRSADSVRVLEAMEAADPHVVLVGMGVPRQEQWMLAHLDRIPGSVLLNCGAAMDYVAGVIPTPPRWAGGLGLEWLFRLAAEPRRLWRRYLVEPWFLARLLLRERRTFARSVRDDAA